MFIATKGILILETPLSFMEYNLLQAKKRSLTPVFFANSITEAAQALIQLSMKNRIK
jgi:hypothetical protein